MRPSRRGPGLGVRRWCVCRRSGLRLAGLSFLASQWRSCLGSLLPCLRLGGNSDRRLWRLERKLRQRHSSEPAGRHQFDAERCAVGERVLRSAALLGIARHLLAQQRSELGPHGRLQSRQGHRRPGRRGERHRAPGTASRSGPRIASATPSRSWSSPTASTRSSSAANIAGCSSAGRPMSASASASPFRMSRCAARLDRPSPHLRLSGHRRRGRRPGRPRVPSHPAVLAVRRL